MTANLVALARMAAGRVAEAAPVFEDLVERLPDMSFPISSLLRCYAFEHDWAAVDRLLELADRRQLREFREGLPFIRTKRDPTPQNVEAWRSNFEAQVNQTGHLDVSRLVYSAHLGLVEEAYRAVETAHMGPAGTIDDIMGPDGYRTSLMFQAGMPELRTTHASHVCVHGWGSLSSGWQQASGPIAPMKSLTISETSAQTCETPQRRILRVF